MVGPNILSIEIADSPDDAPNWNRDFPDVRSCHISKAIIVSKGMESGKATVDLVVTDLEGNKFVAMLTGDLIKSLARAIEGVAKR